MRSLFIAVVLAVSLCSVAIASDVPAVTNSTKIIKAGTGIVRGFSVAYKGATAGDWVDLAQPSSDTTTRGDAIFKSVAYNANWTDHYYMPAGATMTAIHCHVSTTAAGTATVTILYE